MKRQQIKEFLLDMSCGLLATTIDMVIFSLLYAFELGTARYGPRRVAKAAENAFEKASELYIDKETTKRAIWKASHLRLIRRQKKDRKYWEITKKGKERLSSLLPFYDEKRTWDDKVYLITYDIPEKQHLDRQLLRDHLKKIGAGMLQASVWLTPYNPRGVIKKFIEEKNLLGTVIVSDIGRDGNIGEEDLDYLISRVYYLEELNERYEDFIDKAKQGKLNRAQIAFEFLSILKDDPQLPFDILPYDWKGRKAYSLFKEKSIPSA